MKKSKRFFSAAVLLYAIFAFTGISNALEIVLEPADVQLTLGGETRVNIFADGAEALISMGVKVSFEPGVLEVVDAAKNDTVEDPENVWRMTVVKEDGATFSYNTPAVEWDNTDGTVTMVGGHLYENMQTGVSTQGLSGKVLLGSIDFRAKAIGSSDLYVDLARYHPQHPAKTFDNFVNLNTGVDEPTNLGDLWVISVMSDSDGDGLIDTYEENVTGTDPLLADTDGDGITDGEEDMDFDGMSNLEEYVHGTHPKEPDIYLFAGLNLVGYPVEVAEGYSSYDLLVELGTEDEISKIQRYNGTAGAFKTTTYDAGVPSGDEFDIVNGEAYYVYMKESKLASFAGHIITPNIELEPGINLVSIPCMPPNYTSYDLLSYLGSADDIASIQRFDRETGAFETTAYYDGQPSGVEFGIVNSDAYLIHMKTAVDMPSLLTAPVVAITFPADGETVASSPIDVSGTVSDSSSSVTVNGIIATVSAGTFTATGVPLVEGSNIITAEAVSANNLTSSHDITVTLENGPM